MDIPTIIGAIGLVLFLLSIGRYSGLKSKARKDYWRGRGDGWRACENMVIERAKEQGYGNAWIELLQ